MIRTEKATRDDVPLLVKLVNSAYRGEEAKKGWTHEADLIEGTMRTDESHLLEYLANPLITILLCRENNSLAGCVYLEKQEDKMYLGMLSVDPIKQARGIGKKLLEASEIHARNMNCKKMEMTVISVREELIRWYERQGYHLSGEKRPFHDDGKFGRPRQNLEFVVLVKNLKPLKDKL